MWFLDGKLLFASSVGVWFSFVVKMKLCVKQNKKVVFLFVFYRRIKGIDCLSRVFVRARRRKEV